jgi:predicted Ser/Thr protein kinase
MERNGDAMLRAALERTLGERYEILELHGQGGMGLVYRARARALEKLVAIKVVTSGSALTAGARERFRREARLAASLSHPSIVSVFDFGETSEFAFYVMAFVHGESLAQRLRHEGPLSPEATRRILMDLAGALDHAHRRGIVHRDIKPENVLIDAETGRALLTDFGIAKLLSDASNLTRTGTVVGTPEYMSPEHAAGGRDIDGRSDLYALGALGYAMLAGRPPHQGNGMAEVMTKHLVVDPVPLRALAPEAPQDLVAGITRCLEKEPDRRWPDARALQAALAREPGEDEPVGEELRAITGFGAFMALVLVAVAAFALEGNDLVGTWAPVLAGLIVSAAFLAYARQIAANGYAMGAVLRVSMWPPKWWGLWWPHALRRPGDAWECLPTSARITRVLLTIMFVSLLMWLPGRSSLPEGAQQPVLWSVVGFSGLVLLIVDLALRHWRRVGFALPDASRLLFGPTVGAAFWSQEHVSAVLITRPDLGPACATPPPNTARAILHAIEDMANRLSGRARESGSEAADAARILSEEVDRLDVEIEKLERDAEPEELAHVERRLAQLHETESDARGHLEQYAKSLRRQADLLELRRSDREEALGLLRAMWTGLERLRVEPGRNAAPEREILERLHALSAAARGSHRPAGANPNR